MNRRRGHCTTPTPTPAPTPTAPTGPYLHNIALYDVIEDPPGSGIWPLYQLGCTSGATDAAVTVIAEDPDGIASVTLYYKPQGVTNPLTADMGDEGGGLYYAYILGNAEWGLGEIDYWIQATDGVGDVSPILHRSADEKIVMSICND